MRMNRLLIWLFSQILFFVAQSSYSADQPVEFERFKGAVKSRFDVKQQSRYLINEGYTQYKLGIAGQLLANLLGVSAHSQYVVYGNSGALLRFSAVEIFEVGDCIEVSGPAALVAVGVAELGQVSVKLSSGCLPVPADPPIEVLPEGEVPKKNGRPN